MGTVVAIGSALILSTGLLYSHVNQPSIIIKPLQSLAEAREEVWKKSRRTHFTTIEYVIEPSQNLRTPVPLEDEVKPLTSDEKEEIELTHLVSLRNIESVIDTDYATDSQYERAALDLLQFCTDIYDNPDIFYQSDQLQGMFANIFLENYKLERRLEKIEDLQFNDLFDCDPDLYIEFGDAHFDDFHTACGGFDLATQIKSACAHAIVDHLPEYRTSPTSMRAKLYAKLTLASSSGEASSILWECAQYQLPAVQFLQSQLALHDADLAGKILPGPVLYCK